MPGKGTTFDIYLPGVQGEEKPESREEETLPTGGERILFVDDEPAIVQMAEKLLKRLGYPVETRRNGLEALECFRADPDGFDLLITDMTMPHMTGDKLVEEVRNIRPDLPVILCTGFSDKIDKERALAMGIREFIMKPLALKELAEAVRKALGG